MHPQCWIRTINVSSLRSYTADEFDILFWVKWVKPSSPSLLRAKLEVPTQICIPNVISKVTPMGPAQQALLCTGFEGHAQQALLSTDFDFANPLSQKVYNRQTSDYPVCLSTEYPWLYPESRSGYAYKCPASTSPSHRKLEYSITCNGHTRCLPMKQNK